MCLIRSPWVIPSSVQYTAVPLWQFIRGWCAHSFGVCQLLLVVRNLAASAGMAVWQLVSFGRGQHSELHTSTMVFVFV